MQFAILDRKLCAYPLSYVGNDGHNDATKTSNWKRNRTPQNTMTKERERVWAKGVVPFEFHDGLGESSH